MFVYRRIPGTHVDGWLLHSLRVPYMCLSIEAHHLEQNAFTAFSVHNEFHSLHNRLSVFGVTIED